MLIIRKSNCINTAYGIVFPLSDLPVCRLKGCSFSTCTLDGHLQRILYLLTRQSLTENTIPAHRTVTENTIPAHRTVTYREYYTCTPDGHLQRVLYLHTGQSLTENTITDIVLIQFDLLMMSTALLETCRGL